MQNLLEISKHYFIVYKHVAYEWESTYITLLHNWIIIIENTLLTNVKVTNGRFCKV